MVDQDKLPGMHMIRVLFGFYTMLAPASEQLESTYYDAE